MMRCSDPKLMKMPMSFSDLIRMFFYDQYNIMCSGRRGQVRPHHPADPEPFRGRVRPHHRGQLQEAGRHRWGDLPPGHTRHCGPGGKFLSLFGRGGYIHFCRENQ
jgi:hypothetical protein